MATIISLAYQPERSEHKKSHHFNRVRTDKLHLLVGHGIVGDFKAGRNPRRQLNIMSLDTVNWLKQIGYNVAPGELGEQVVVDGIDVDGLPSGTQLQLGAEAVVEITMPRTSCERLGVIHGRENAAEETAGKMGMLAMVVTSGTVHVGDAVQVLEPVASVAAGYSN